MKQAILYGAGDLRLEERALDSEGLQPDQVYVETEVTAFSTGTDLGNYLGDSTHVPDAPDYPRTVGYSNVGIVRKIGATVSGIEPGQRVFSMKPHQSAFIAGPNDVLVGLPEAVSPEQASLAYLTQLGLAALQQAHYEPGENVVIVGLGVIGLCTAALARAMGAHVVGIASAEVRAEAALRVGAHAALSATDPGLTSCLNTEFHGNGSDIVVLTANSWEAWRLSMNVARSGTRVCVLGFPGRAQPQPDFNPLDPTWLYAKGLTILGSGWTSRLRRNLEYILDLMATGEMALEPLISHRLPAHRMVEAYELAKVHSKDLVAAIFDWR